MAIDETTTKYVLEWRAHIGPQWARDDASAFYDWSALNVGGTFTDITDTHIEADLEPAATSIALHSAAAFPSAGGLWLSGNATGEAWEYCPYTGKSTNTLTGLTRETVDTEQTGHHTAGATARFFWGITTDDGTLTVSRRADEALSSLQWVIELRGATVPQAALRLGHLVIIERREATGAAGDFGAWTIAQVGWITNVRVVDRGNAGNDWTVTVGGLNELLRTLRAPGIMVGRPNDARGGSAQASTELAAWYKEFTGGELPGSNPDVSPAAAIDGDLDTLYMSERHLGTANWPPGPDANWPSYGIDQVHISAFPGQGKGYRWIQARVSRLTPLRLMNQDRYWIKFKDFHIPDEGDWVNGKQATSIIICENLAAFQAENPDIDGSFMVHETSSEDTVYQHAAGAYNANSNNSQVAMTVGEWWDSLAPAGGALSLACGDQGYGVLIWGTETAAHLESNHGWTGVDWTGASQAAPVAGQTLRRFWNQARNTEGAWGASYVSTPGYWMGQFNSKAYYCLERPPMGLVLTNDITDVAPGAGDTLLISVGDTPGTNGLDAAGTLQVGAEQISYSAKVAGGVTVTARGANSTTTAAHNAGETIYQIEDGLATDVWLLASVQIVRPTGGVPLKNFTLYGSRNVVQGRLPGESNWTDDWDALAIVTNNTDTTWTYTWVSGNSRYKWLLVQPSAMGTNDYRLCINEFRTYAHGSACDPGTYLEPNSTVADVAAAILDGVGVPAGARLEAAGGDDTPQVNGFVTAPDMAMDVLADLADMTGCFAKVEADSKVRTTLHPWFGGTPSISRTWSKTTASRFEPEWRNGRAISQVILAWMGTDGETTGTAKYPATADTSGDVLKLEGPYIVADQSAADVLAEKKYWAVRLPNGATVEATGAPWDAEPGVAEGVSWQIDTAMLAMSRNYLLDTVDVRVEGGGLTVVAHGAAYGREDER